MSPSLSLGLSVVQGREAGEPKEKKGKSLLDDDDDEEEEVVDESPEEVGQTMIHYRAKHVCCTAFPPGGALLSQIKQNKKV